MSAICGIVNFDGKPVAEDEIRRMMTAMSHYGPDGSGLWVKGGVGLGSLQLHSTPESVNERQPLFAQDDQIVLVCDARIDNRDELCAPLGVSKDEPDSVVVLRAFQKWRESCPSRLIGDFSLAIWDHQNRTLLLANDHRAGRPLFYTRFADTLVFATSVFGTFSVTGMPDLDDEQLVNYLLLRHGEPTRTYYAGLSRLPVGHTAILRGGDLRLRPYWKAEDVPDIRLARDDLYLEAFLDCYTRAVRAVCRSRRPVGIMLSGGLDSGSVAVLASRELRVRGQRLEGYCSVPFEGFVASALRGWLVDERPLVELLRRQEGFHVEYVHSGREQPWTVLDQDFEASGGLTATLRNRFWIWAIAARASESGLGVVLSGQAGNCTISWAGRGYLASLVDHGRYAAWLLEVWRRHEQRGWPLASMRETVLPLLPKSMWSHLRRRRARLLCGSVFLRPSSRNRELAADDASLLTFRPNSNTRSNRQATFPPPASNEFYAATGAAKCIEFRDPTADRRVIEFAWGIPDSQHVRGGETRMVLRRAFAHMLPKEIVSASQRGKQAADAIEQLRDHWPTMRDAIARFEKNELAASILDLAALRSALDWIAESVSTPEALHALDRILRAVAAGSFCLWHSKGLSTHVANH